MKKEYQMTEVQYQKIMDACRPVPYMVIGGMEPRSPQENANDAWMALATELGFIWDTVRPIPGKSSYFFSAEPMEIAK